MERAKKWIVPVLIGIAVGIAIMALTPGTAAREKSVEVQQMELYLDCRHRSPAPHEMSARLCYQIVYGQDAAAGHNTPQI